MSTSWYFVCVSHDPELYEEDGVSGSGDSGLRVLQDLWDRRESIVATYDQDDEGWYDPPNYRSRWFLTRHRNCRLMIESEYRVRVDPATQERKEPPHHCPTCRCRPE